MASGTIQRNGTLATSRQSALVTAISSTTAQAESRIQSATRPAPTRDETVSASPAGVNADPDPARLAGTAHAITAAPVATNPTDQSRPVVERGRPGSSQNGKASRAR